MSGFSVKDDNTLLGRGGSIDEISASFLYKICNNNNNKQFLLLNVRKIGHSLCNMNRSAVFFFFWGGKKTSINSVCIGYGKEGKNNVKYSTNFFYAVVIL